MKPLFYLLFLSALLVACGGESEPKTLAEKEAKVKELQKAASELNKKIAALEAAINQEKGIKPEDLLRQVEVMPLQANTFEHFIEVQGDVQSDKDVQVFPKAGGTVLKRYVKEGQRVNAGQVIAELDAETIKKGIAEVQTRLDLAKIVFQKQENLWKQKIGTEIQYLQAKNNMEALEKSLETQKTTLANAFVKAPISGTLDEFFINAGEMASPSMPMARVVNLSSVEIGAEVSESYTKSIKRGDEVMVKFPAIGLEMPVRISLIGQRIDPVNRTFRIEMSVPNRDGSLKPNASAVVKIKDFEQKNAISVPSHLIQQSADGSRFLYTVEGDKTKKVIIEVGQSYQGYTLVTKGLNEGDKVVVKGYSEVIDGEEVKVEMAEQS